MKKNIFFADNLASAWSAGGQELRVGAVSVVGGPSKRRADSDSTSPCSAIRPVLVVGMSEQAGASAGGGVSPHVRVMNSVNQASSALHIMKVVGISLILINGSWGKKA